jgi:hypothetical protein
VFSTVDNLIRTLPALPHATVGNPEDADSNAEDHAPDAGRYLLINLGGGPEFVILEDLPKPSPADELRPYVPMGAVAIVKRDNDPYWPDDEPKNTVQQSPFV